MCKEGWGTPEEVKLRWERSEGLWHHVVAWQRFAVQTWHGPHGKDILEIWLSDISSPLSYGLIYRKKHEGADELFRSKPPKVTLVRYIRKKICFSIE